MSTKKYTPKSQIPAFKEDPYDLETLLESIHMSSLENKELLFLDKFITNIKENPDDNTVEVSYRVLRELDILRLEKADS